MHVLCYCIRSNDPKGPDFWKIFLGKLMPRSAVDSSNNAEKKIWLYFRKWYDKMEIPPPSEEQLEVQLEFYHQLNYLSDASRKVGEIKNIVPKKDGSSQVKKSLGKATSTNGKNPSPPKDKTTKYPPAKPKTNTTATHGGIGGEVKQSQGKTPSSNKRPVNTKSQQPPTKKRKENGSRKSNRSPHKTSFILLVCKFLH